MTASSSATTRSNASAVLAPHPASHARALRRSFTSAEASEPADSRKSLTIVIPPAQVLDAPPLVKPRCRWIGSLLWLAPALRVGADTEPRVVDPMFPRRGPAI